MASPHPTKTDLSAEYVRRLLDYDPETGAFFWRERPGESIAVRLWNARFAGQAAGTVVKKPGKNTSYREIGIDGDVYRAHDLAWLIVHGEWPSRRLDHRDGDGLYNGISNLRPATNSQNIANSRLRKDNLAGFKGVSSAGRRYRARLRHQGKSRHLGCFDTPEEAHAAYMKAAREMFGEFANPGYDAPKNLTGRDARPDRVSG